MYNKVNSLMGDARGNICHCYLFTYKHFICHNFYYNSPAIQQHNSKLGMVF